MQILQNVSKKHYTILLIILVLSAYVHLWNPVGFPDVFFDEGIYMRRALNVLETGNPQEAIFYDHPYFGQLVLAGVLKLAGFPQTVEQSLELSYLIPRLLMGLFAILDTFLLYKITEKKFGRNVAILAAILFAVMPISWLLRRILLDNILLPLMLSSILLAVYSKDSKNQSALIFGSSILLGLAIFTKITAVTMIPIVGYIIFSNQKNIKHLIKWLPPVFLIPMIWPAVSLYLRHFNYWINDVFWQAGRNTGDFVLITGYILAIDPVFTSLAFASFVYAVMYRKLFLIFWFAPFLIFVNTIGYFQYFHYILLLPVMCISIGFMLESSLKKIKRIKLQNYCLALIIVGFAVFGTVISSMLISTDMTSEQFNVMRFTLANFDDADTTLLAGPVYSWIFADVYDKNNVPNDYSLILFEPINTEKFILIADPHFIVDLSRGEQLQQAYDQSETRQEFHGKIKEINTNTYPYWSMLITNEGQFIEFKTNWEQSWRYP